MNPGIALYSALIVFSFHRMVAQIASPGMGSNSNIDSWFAVGIRQDLDTLGKIRSVSYIGTGRKSKPVDFNALENEALIVLNQEFYHQIKKHWQCSYALSYRREDEYEDMPPYGRETPFYRHEFRIYTRLSYLQNSKNAKYSVTLRQELRKFHTSGALNLAASLQFRTRLKIQYTCNLNQAKIHRLTFGAEMLFKTERENNYTAWSGYTYDESRLTCFYSYAPKQGRVICSVGYMEDIEDIKNVSYLMINLVFVDLFGLLKMKRNNDSSDVY